MKSKTLIMTAILGLGLASCSKEDDAIAPSNDKTTVVSQNLATPFNMFNGKVYFIRLYTQNKAENTNMRRIRLKFNSEGLLEVVGTGVNEKAGWGFNDIDKRLIIRSNNGKNSLMNFISSDVWRITSMDGPTVTLTAKYPEMSRQMVIEDISGGQVHNGPLLFSNF